jgi:hypothetical protein
MTLTVETRRLIFTLLEPLNTDKYLVKLLIASVFSTLGVTQLMLDLNLTPVTGGNCMTTTVSLEQESE